MEFRNERVTALFKKYYSGKPHPFNLFENVMANYLSKEMVLLDAGCGREAPVLNKFVNKAKRLIGVDLATFYREVIDSEIELLESNLERLPIESQTVDMVISRSVLEHLDNVEVVFAEINRIMKVDGYFIFLVPNIGDYVSIISKMIPNKLHSFIMAKTEGRNQLDTFPTHYRANSYRRISKLAVNNGFEILSFEYLSQYPSSLVFSSIFFLLGTAYDKIIEKHYCLRFLRGWILAVLKKHD